MKVLQTRCPVDPQRKRQGRPAELSGQQLVGYGFSLKVRKPIAQGLGWIETTGRGELRWPE